ncbi:rifamycin-inactivating phosphotransferase [Ruania zhangjianzhongii]|uniref:rifamycin-inactivating phosphotransferase n=1 Tax=Ruania zhangjianzhongii TaxID=2603206 RepID=UPI0011CA343A|nr:rifamycin-inactivating phosphotransferase [Ruania zhangjianzhongii]
MTETYRAATVAAENDRYVLSLGEIRQEQLPLVGGKGANLGELSPVDGADVPDGYCVTTTAFREVLAGADWLAELLDGLGEVEATDHEGIGALSAQLRDGVRQADLSADLAEAIVAPLVRFAPGTAFAVRSSATAEDLPTASFAGQQDSYLNVIGADAVLAQVRACWASLFTDRAVAYRLHHGIDHRAVTMAVVVQEMVAADAAGVLFTADPVTSNRTVTTVEAGFGLGEALVSGLVNPDVYQVTGSEVTTRTVGVKAQASYAVDGGGTREEALPPDHQTSRVLTDAQVLQLAELGRRIEAHFGRPQDVEWCLDGERFHIVQSRPITTLFPIPETDKPGNRVYLSVGHQQMMTDAIKPLGLSFWQMTTPRPMAVAGGRLFVDVTDRLATPTTRDALLEGMGRSDPLMRDALETVLAREDFLPEVSGEPVEALPQDSLPPIDADPDLVTELIGRAEASLAVAEREIAQVRGAELFDFILADFPELRQRVFDSESLQAIMAGIGAAWWLNENLGEWLGEESPADALTQSAANNVTSQMGLALLDVADVIRPHPEVVAFLRATADEQFLDQLPDLSGGEQARAAIQEYLDSYGMRCIGEIDLTRPRWSEQPAALLPAILANVDAFEPGEAERRFEAGLQVSRAKEHAVLERVRLLPDGEEKAAQTKQMIDRVRVFTGYREYPKYGMISRYFVYKQALMREAQVLVDEGVLADAEEVYYLTFEEFAEAVRSRRVDHSLIRSRAAEHAASAALTPPRVLTSDGESVLGQYRREDLPEGALPGLPVSAGTVEGRARVVRDVADADLVAGDILVTAFTDPSWSPLFVTIAGLVTEVGGLMTHGAVVAREYGLTAVVGVEGATDLIRDGQRIRVNGTTGYVEILS